MPAIGSLLERLDERTIAQLVGIPHDEARMCYQLQANTISSFPEFSNEIGDYYNHHFTSCVSNGGALSHADAAGRAKEILEREYCRHQGDIVEAFNDAHDGTKGGMRRILDHIAEGLKAESVELYIREVFDRHVAPNAWEEKVEIIRAFIAECGVHLASSIRADQPERYANNFEELIRSYVSALQRTSSVFRRM